MVDKRSCCPGKPDCINGDMPGVGTGLIPVNVLGIYRDREMVGKRVKVDI